MFVDSHIHLSHKLYDGKVPCASPISERGIEHYSREELITELKNSGIGFVVEPAIDLESNYKLLNLAEEHAGYVYPAVGVHPTRTWSEKWNRRHEIKKLADRTDVVAIGEIGLDYHHDRKNQHRLIQKQWFLFQLKLACKKQLPVVLHIRDAHKDAIKILRRHKPVGGIVHCFNGLLNDANEYVKLGLKIGIGGSIFTNPKLEETIRKISIEDIVLETDGPHVKGHRPEGLSKKQWEKARNTSLIIPLEVAPKIAEVKGISLPEVEEITTKTVKDLFHI